MTAEHRKEDRVKGVPVSEGCVVARVCLFNERRHSNLPMYRVEGTGVEREKKRIVRAVEIAAKRLDDVRVRVTREVGPAEGEIFVAQKMILEDASLRKELETVVSNEGANAEMAVVRVLDAYEARLASMDDEYVRDRASDFGEIRRRLLDVLSNMKPELQCAGEEHCQRGKDRIIVAEELTASMTVDLDTEHVLGFVTERGGPHSHGGILARALGIPAVTGVTGVRDRVSCGTELLVDGTKGEVVFWPAEETVAAVCAAQRPGLKESEPVDAVEGLRVMANIRIAEDAAEALRMRAEGIGLYRTEIEVIAAGRLFTEDEYYTRYAHVQESMGGRPVVFRLLDVGSDKPLPFLPIPREENPSLGWRGGRLLLDRKDLLRTQARALARLSLRGEVRVMYPMVVDLEQFLALRRTFEEAIADMERGKILQGVMLEVPSACLQAREILKEADFASLGTNDLIQYLFAVDRNNELVAADFHAERPVLWRLLEDVAAAARETGKELSLCGELGGDPRYIARLMAMGIRTVSTAARRISAVRVAAAAAVARGV